MSNNSNKKEYSKAERLEDAKEWIFKYKGNNIEEFYSKKYNVDNFTAYEELVILEYYKIDGLVDDIFDVDSNPKSYTESQFELFKKYDKFWKSEYEELKKYFDDAVEKTLRNMRFPSKSDVDRLHASINNLEEKINDLTDKIDDMNKPRRTSRK